MIERSLVLAATLALAGFDAWFSSRRIKLGTVLESNPACRKAYEAAGTAGLTAAIMLPQMVISGGFAYFGFDGPLWFMFGVRSFLALLQSTQLRRG